MSVKVTQLEAMVKLKGFKSLEDYLKDQYLVNRYSLDAVAADLEISINKLRQILDEFHIIKPENKIPISLKDAKRLSLDSIAKTHGVSRSTAWRWKKTILDTEKALEDS